MTLGISRSTPQARNPDADAMTINVKFLSEQQIERDALELLENYF